MKTLPCPVKEDCEIRFDESLSYSSIRRACRNHLERAHEMPLTELSGFLRTMLGDFYRESPEYEMSDLPAWPETTTVQLDSKK